MEKKDRIHKIYCAALCVYVFLKGEDRMNGSRRIHQMFSCAVEPFKQVPNSIALFHKIGVQHVNIYLYPSSITTSQWFRKIGGEHMG